jgi:predicted nucleotidyltransferase component of viral defense system
MELPLKHPSHDIHQDIMREIFLSVTDTPMVLKGGTALLLCYGLDRPSEDLDFDSSRKMGLERRIENALQNRYRIDDLKTLKDTDTVQRLRLTYTHLQTTIQGSLKIETSFRQVPPSSQVDVINGIRVYKLDNLFQQKARAFYQRTAARDLYDLAFILGQTGFVPDRGSLARIHQDLIDPKRFWEIDQQFRQAFQIDPLLSSYDFDKVLLQLSERIEEAYKKSLSIQPSQSRGLRM